MNTSNTTLPEMVIEPYAKDFAMPDEMRIYPFGKEPFAGNIQVFHNYEEFGGGVVVRLNFGFPSDGISAEHLARIIEALTESQRIAQHLSAGSDAQTYVSTRDVLQRELTVSPDNAEKIDFLRHVLADYPYEFTYSFYGGEPDLIAGRKKGQSAGEQIAKVTIAGVNAEHRNPVARYMAASADCVPLLLSQLDYLEWFFCEVVVALREADIAAQDEEGDTLSTISRLKLALKNGDATLAELARTSIELTEVKQHSTKDSAAIDVTETFVQQSPHLPTCELSKPDGDFNCTCGKLDLEATLALEYAKSVGVFSEPQVEPKNIERGQVYRNSNTGEKVCVRGPKSTEKVSGDEWVKVADTPHGDEDFSYMCGSEWCRCIS